jgi:hypothetical protein
VQVPRQQDMASDVNGGSPTPSALCVHIPADAPGGHAPRSAQHSIRYDEVGVTLFYLGVRSSRICGARIWSSGPERCSVLDNGAKNNRR